MKKLWPWLSVAAVLMVHADALAQRTGPGDRLSEEDRGRLRHAGGLARSTPTPSFSGLSERSGDRAVSNRASLIPESRPSSIRDRPPNVADRDWSRPILRGQRGGGRAINTIRDPSDLPNVSDRSSGAERPGGPSLADRSSIRDRPPNVADRDWSRPILRGQRGGGRAINTIRDPSNWPTNQSSRPVDRPIYINNRPINIDNLRAGSRPWYDHHFHPWLRGYWGWWRPRGWSVGGASAGWLMAPPEPTFVFNNPFYHQSATMFNYSQSLPAPAWDDNAPSIHADETAIDIFDQAREAFQRNEHKEALALVDKAIQQLPTDVTLHEFRALCLFALQDYKAAAATLYAVLAAGPGWDWETMRSLYGDVATYTDHLRLLEGYLKANPKSPAARFVLAYHYLVLGHQTAAIQELENVVKLLPDSQLSAEMLAALRFESTSELPLPK